MQCLRCQGDSPPHAEFCVECGARLRLRCAQCGVQLPPDAKFCLACGVSQYMAGGPFLPDRGDEAGSANALIVGQQRNLAAAASCRQGTPP